MADDLFFERLVGSYVVGNPRFLARSWLAEQAGAALADPGCRFLLLTAEPGAGKTAFLAWLAHEHPGWLRYFIREDQRSPLGDPGTNRFLLQVGFQLAAHLPELFSQEQLRVAIEQRISTVTETGEAVGVQVERLLASPFYQTVVDIRQQVEQSRGSVTGIRIRELITDPRLIPTSDLQFMALIDPAMILRRSRPEERIVVLVDALDELRYREAGATMLDWLATCPNLPANVRLILTCRPDEALLARFRGAQQPRLRELFLDPDDADVRADLETYARALTREPAVAAVQQAEGSGKADTFVVQAVDKANGNIGYLDAVGRGIDQALRQQDQRLLKQVLTLSELPDSLEGLHKFFLDQLENRLDHISVTVDDPTTGEVHFLKVWPDIYQRLLGVLAVAREPLTLDQARTFGGISVEPGYLKNEAMKYLRQFLDIDESRPAATTLYSLYHQSFADFLLDEGHAGRHWRDPKQQHKRIADAILRNHASHWAGCDDYALQHLPAHLVGAHDDKRLLDLLKHPFLSAKAQRFSYRFVLDDLRIGEAAAKRHGDLPALTRMAIARGGLKQRVGDLPGQAAQRLIPIYAAAGQIDRALDLANLIEANWLREKILRLIVWVVAAFDLDRSTAIAERIENPQSRAEALALVLKAMTLRKPAPPNLHDALDPLLGLIDRSAPVTPQGAYWKGSCLQLVAETLGPIDPRRSTQILQRAVDAARTIETDPLDYEAVWRYEVLRNVARMVAARDQPQALDLYDEALTALEHVPDGTSHADMVGSTVGEIAALDTERGARAVARVRSVVDRPFALAHLAHHMACCRDPKAASLAEEATKAVAAIRSLHKAEVDDWQEEAAARVAWAIAARDVQAATDFIEQKLPRKIAKDKALSRIVADPVHPVEQALPLTRQISDLERRGQGLAGLARRRIADDVVHALELASEIPDVVERCRALVHLAGWLAEHEDPRANTIIERATDLAATAPHGRAPLLADMGAQVVRHDRHQAMGLWKQALQAVITTAGSEDGTDACATVAWGLYAAGDPDGALEVARQGLISALRIRDQPWVIAAQVQPLAELSRRDPDRALAMISELPDQLRAFAMAEAVALQAEVDRSRATNLFEEFSKTEPPGGWDRDRHGRELLAGARALAALVLEASRCGSRDTLELADRLWRYGGSLYPAELKCDALAEASGLLAAHDLNGARHLLEVIMSELHGEGRPVGSALASIGQRDAGLAASLARRIARSLSESSQDNSIKICEIGEEIAGFAPELALELSSAIQESWGSVGEADALRGRVQARVAAVTARADRSRVGSLLAESLVNQALQLAERASTTRRVDTMLASASALLEWDTRRALQLADEARRVANNPDPALNLGGRISLAGKTAARAAVIALAADLLDRAHALMEQAIEALQQPEAWPVHQEIMLETIEASLLRFPMDLQADLRTRLLHAILDSERLLFEQPWTVIRLLLDAPSRTGDAVELAFLAEVDTALELIERVFIG
jgi:hypothetical protein